MTSKLKTLLCIGLVPMLWYCLSGGCSTETPVGICNDQF